jgi:hypothetical protein
MTQMTAVIKFVISMTITVTLAFIAWSGAAKHFAALDSMRAKHSAGLNSDIAELPNPALSRVRLLVSNLNLGLVSRAD